MKKSAKIENCGMGESWEGYRVVDIGFLQNMLFLIIGQILMMMFSNELKCVKVIHLHSTSHMFALLSCISFWTIIKYLLKGGNFVGFTLMQPN